MTDGLRQVSLATLALNIELASLNPTPISREVADAFAEGGNILAMIEAHNALRERARAGDPAAILEVAEEDAYVEDARFNYERERALRKARRRWRQAYQWAKWGE